MVSGRKEKVMIACVTIDTVKVAKPIEIYESNRVHILHTSKPGTIYQDFYDQTVKLIEEYRGGRCEIEEHNNVRVWVFKDMLRLIISIIEDERKKGPCEIMINISAGSPEYSAAATIAAMMYENTQAFAASADKFTLSDPEDLKKMYYKDFGEKDADGNPKLTPVGATLAIKDPVCIASYEIQKPDRRLVRGLRLYHSLVYTNESGRIRTNKVKAADAVAKLKTEDGLWVHEPTSPSNEAVYFRREFVEPWLEREWIVKDDYKRYVTTPEGIRTFQTFYLSEQDRGEDWIE